MHVQAHNRPNDADRDAEVTAVSRNLVDEAAALLGRQLRIWLSDHQAEQRLDGGLVFVVCSFDPDMDPVFDAVSCAAASCGLRAVRVKDYHGDYRITDKILTLVRDARLVVADLSHEKPNVYFELGYARGLGKTVITILRAGTVAHFDVHDWPYLEYIDSRPLERQLRERFRFEMGGAPPDDARPRAARSSNSQVARSQATDDSPRPGSS